jgi:hypothetical protein
MSGYGMIACRASRAPCSALCSFLRALGRSENLWHQGTPFCNIAGFNKLKKMLDCNLKVFQRLSDKINIPYSIASVESSKDSSLLA